MSKAERGFVPLHQVESDRLQVHATLPYVDPNEIGINVHRVERMMGLAGFANLEIVAQDGEVTSSTPVIAGHTPNGEAFAGRIATKTKAVTHTVELHKPDDRCEFHSFNWAHAKVTLNTTEVSDRIMHGGSLRSPQQWSRYLNRAVRDGLSSAGFNHLVYGWKPESLAYDGSVIMIVAGAGAAGTKWALIAAGIAEAFVNIAWPYVHTGTPQKCKNPHDRLRPSLLVGPQLERAMALQAATKFSKLVKPLNAS